MLRCMFCKKDFELFESIYVIPDYLGERDTCCSECYEKEFSHPSELKQ